NGVCSHGSQCETGICSIPIGQGCGLCVAAKALNATCDPKDGCGPGLVCSAQTSTCVAFGTVGSACDESAPCHPSLICLGAMPGQFGSGTCTAPLALGATCSNTSTTAPRCDALANQVCNPSTGVCENVVLHAAGGSCGIINGVVTICEDSGFCKFNP